MTNENRNRYLLMNTIVFALGNIGSKMISFFLIPLYTNALSTKEYGAADLISTISMVTGPIITLNIAEAVMRFGLDKNAEKDKNTQCGFFIFFFSVFAGTILIPICNNIEGIQEYSFYVYFYVISLAFNQLFLCDLRGKELLVQYSICNILQTFLIAVLNIVFLLGLKMKTDGFLLAYIVANFIVAIIAVIMGKGYRSFRLRGIEKKTLKNMIRYSVVLIPNTFMWWIMNSSDRMMVTYMVGAAANGIYAISYKIPTLVSTLTNIFNQAWSYSAIREEGTSDEDDYSNRVLENLISTVVIMGLFLLLITKPFFRIYVASDYYEAWKYTPFLVVGCVYLTIGTFMATSYTVHKDSFGYLFSGMFGAILNIILNFCMIPLIGVYGASLATCISYIAVFVFRFFHTRKYIHYNVFNKEFILETVFLLLSAVLMFIDNSVGILLQIAVLLFDCVLFYKNWLLMLKNIFHKIKNRKLL